MKNAVHRSAHRKMQKSQEKGLKGEVQDCDRIVTKRYFGGINEEEGLEEKNRGQRINEEDE